MAPTVNDLTSHDRPGHDGGPYLSARGLSKRYGPIRALADVDLDLWAGEIHALVGENGAGKSTLKKVLAGEEHLDTGEISIAGRPVRLSSPMDAQAQGIAVVHQHFPMVDAMTVAENMNLGTPPCLGPAWLPLVDRRSLIADAEAALDGFGLAALARRRARELTVAERQVVAIATALRRDTRLLILDEPTSSLNASEVESLFAHVGNVRESGAAVVFITHSMEEVLAIADRITVLRDGRHVATVAAAGVDTGELVRMIVGRDLAKGYPKPDVARGGTLLRAVGARARGGRSWSFDVRQSEILGVPAHMGSGIEELLQTVSGQRSLSGGELSLAGRDLSGTGLRERIRAGICLVPGDAAAEGLVPKMSVEENVLLPNLRRHSRFGIMRRRGARQLCLDLIRLLDIRPPDPSARVEALSGGNRQKVVIAKWLAAGAKLLVMDDPTKGVDVGAKIEIYSVIGDIVSKGGGILLASTDLDELLGLADRIVVIREGRIVGEVARPAFDKAAILERIVGGLPGEGAAVMGRRSTP